VPPTSPLAQLLALPPPPLFHYWNLRGEAVPFRRGCPEAYCIDGREPNNWRQHQRRVDSESREDPQTPKTLAKVVEITERFARKNQNTPKPSPRRRPKAKTVALARAKARAKGHLQ
jgi:hypothetical protein